jgi:acyl-CoA hydrolase
MTTPLAAAVWPGDTLVAGQTLGEPTALLSALFDAVRDGPDMRLFSGMSLSSIMKDAPLNVELYSFVGLGTNSTLLAEGRLHLVPCHMSDLPQLLSSGPLKADVALVLVGPPDKDGNCSLGVASDYIWPVATSARTVLAEINENVPSVQGDTVIPFDRIDGFVRSNRALVESPRTTPSPIELAIAERISPFVHDGTCLQIGVGKLGEAILRSVSNRTDLGVHSGMVGDTILELVRDGIITNTHKPLDEGLTVAGSILGSRLALELAASDRSLRLRSVGYTHDPGVIGQLPDFLCVNSAIEVDLLGQVNSEYVSTRYVGATGGAVDYLRGAARAPGGRSVVALPATASRGMASRIVPRVQHVTALGTDVDSIVTEYGTAELRGRSRGDRARRIAELAAPQFREQLRQAATTADR